MEKETCMAIVLALTLKEIRIEKEIKQSAVAEGLGMTTAGWGKLENGKTLISVENMDCACSVLEVSPIKLLERVNTQIDFLKTKGWKINNKRVTNDGLVLGLAVYGKMTALPFIGGAIGVMLGPVGMVAGAVVNGSIALKNKNQKPKVESVINKAITGYDFIARTKEMEENKAKEIEE